MASEPQGDTKINSAFMKALTGNDPISFRSMYKEKVETFDPQFKLILLCNDVPAMDVNDLGVWNRCRCIKFPTVFVTNPTKPNEKLIDKFLKAKLVDFKYDFILLLIDYYKLYCKHGLIPTDNIMKLTNKYKIENDIFLEYTKACFKESDNHVGISVVYNHFNRWCFDNYPRGKKYGNKEIRSGIKKYYKIWPSVAVKIDDQDKTVVGIKNIELLDLDLE